MKNEIGTSYLPVTRFVNDLWNDNMHWNKPAPYFFYPYCLVTPFVTGMKTVRSDFGSEAKNMKVFADSGGFQVVTLDKRISHLDVLHWQEGIADVGFSLDIPPYSYDTHAKGYSGYTNDYFKKCMRLSCNNANEMLEAKQNPDMELWSVLQGKNSSELMAWHKYQTKSHDFPGYCISINAAVHTKTEKFSWLDQLNVTHLIDKPLHWLGRCEPLVVMLLAKLSTITGNKYTYDTSSTIVGSRFGKYYDPYNHSLLWLSKYEENRPNISTLPCDCPICSKHTIDDLSNTKSPHLMVLHNLYCRVRYNDYVNAIITDDELFNKAIKQYLFSTGTNKKSTEQIMTHINHIIYNEDKHSLKKFF